MMYIENLGLAFFGCWWKDMMFQARSSEALGCSEESPTQPTMDRGHLSRLLIFGSAAMDIDKPM